MKTEFPPQVSVCSLEPNLNGTVGEGSEDIYEAIVFDDPLDGSMDKDKHTQMIGTLLLAAGVFLLVNPLVLPIFGGMLRLAFDLACLLAIFFGVERVFVASRRIRVRSYRARPGEVWKEALRAEHDGRFSEAARLYRCMADCFPNTNIAEDAKNSLKLLAKEHVDMAA